jgi:5-methylcytosine-specific restriction endonuclease McrA
MGVPKPLLMAIRQTPQYRIWKSDVFTRDNHTCQECFKRGGDIHAHHINPFSLIIIENNIKTIEDGIRCEELWNINNGKTLCKHCHMKLHGLVKA